MKVTPTELPEVLMLEPKVFGDARGFFLESYNRRAFNEAVGYDVEFVQDNHSRSARGVLRGLHYQLPPHAQGKLVRVVRGAVFDVAVDVRRGSPTFGKWDRRRAQRGEPPAAVDSAGIRARLPGAERQCADFLYKTTDYYAPHGAKPRSAGTTRRCDRLAARASASALGLSKVARCQASGPGGMGALASDPAAGFDACSRYSRASAAPGPSNGCTCARALGPRARLHCRRHRRRELLAELDTPLVERVHVPDHGLHEHLVLVPRDQPPERARPEAREQDHAARPVPDVHLVRHQPIDLGLGRALGLQVRPHLLHRLAESEGLGLRKAVG